MTSPHRSPATFGPGSVVEAMGKLSPRPRAAFRKRLDTLVRTLTDRPGVPVPEAVQVVADEVGLQSDRLWLAYSVLAAEMPTDEDMHDVIVRARAGGPWHGLRPVLAMVEEARWLRDVEVLRGAVTCDVHTTVGSEVLSGIQRVVRETTMRWTATHEVELVAWVKHCVGLRRVRDDELRRLFGDGVAPGTTPHSGVVVPWECTHLWGEVITDVRRTGRLLALAQYSRNEVVVLAHDSIPITSAATVAGGMTSHFARGMAAVRRARRVAMVSRASAAEFVGVMAMGAGRRDAGPEVAAVPLAVTSRDTTPADLAEARRGLVIDGLPMVLVVGSHEPRKNHLAVLHAAELLWRDGLQFNLVMVGAGSWNAAEYERRVDELVGAGRPIQSLRGLPDRLLWAAYRLAHCTVFPSLNEGFGLPVAESLLAGTPVITSGFGSMQEIVAPDGVPLGGLFVDPRDDASLVDALRTLLSDGVTYERLRGETAQHRERTWDEYAEEVWSFLVDGVRPTG